MPITAFKDTPANVYTLYQYANLGYGLLKLHINTVITPLCGGAVVRPIVYIATALVPQGTSALPGQPLDFKENQRLHEDSILASLFWCWAHLSSYSKVCKGFSLSPRPATNLLV